MLTRCFDVIEERNNFKIDIVTNIMAFYEDYFLYNNKQLTNDVIIVDDKLSGSYYDPKCNILAFYSLSISSDRIIGMLKRTINKYKKMGMYR